MFSILKGSAGIIYNKLLENVLYTYHYLRSIVETFSKYLEPPNSSTGKVEKTMKNQTDPGTSAASMTSFFQFVILQLTPLSFSVLDRDKVTTTSTDCQYKFKKRD